MSIFSDLEGEFTTTEQDVIDVIANIKNDITVAESDITSALNWLAGEVPTIVTALEAAAGLASSVGLVSAPELAAAEAAVQALQSFAAAQNSGSGTITADAQAVVAGYVALKQSQATTASAAATAAATVAKPATATGG